MNYWHPLVTAAYGEEETRAVLECLRAKKTTMGERVRQFETEFACFVGVKHAVMVNSGSSADLLMAMLLTSPRVGRFNRRSAGVAHVPAVTWPTHVWPLIMAGFRVNLVDVDPRTLNVSEETLAQAANINTPDVVSIVHLLGNPAPLPSAAVLVQEDCCEALGAHAGERHVGIISHTASFSFFFSHHMTTMEGGAVVTNSDEDADELRMMRSHGWLRATDPSSRYVFPTWGFNVRPTELQGAFGLEQLKKLPARLVDMSALAVQFFRFLGESKWLRAPAVRHDVKPSWMALPVMVKLGAPYTRDDFVGYLESSGVESRPIVTGNLARQPVAKLLREEGLLAWDTLPGADEVHQRGFYVGLYPGMNVERLIETFENFR